MPRLIQLIILRQIKALERDVFPDGKCIRKLKGLKGAFYRLRVGEYRAVFDVESDSVTIHRVINRKDLERVISTLK